MILERSRDQNPAIENKMNHLFAMDTIAVDYQVALTAKKITSTDLPDKADILVTEPA
jgi:hypothetical protein